MLRYLIMSFQEQYLQIILPVQNDIDKVTKNVTSGINIKEPLKSKLTEIINPPSKHIRAAAAFLYLRANGKPIDENQILLQIAVELVHNASLIHDDVIDDSSLRRNKKTLNSEFGNKLAIISGDYLLSIALKKICMINSTELTKMFAQTLDNMCHGEINQHFNKFKIPTLEEYIIKSGQKTSSLFETAINGSAFLAGLQYNDFTFAKNFGIAFQIRDDLINAKTTKSDINDGIYTAPVIFSKDTKKKKKGIEKTVLLLNNYIDKAIKSLENIEDNLYKQKLKELAELLANA